MLGALLVSAQLHYRTVMWCEQPTLLALFDAFMCGRCAPLRSKGLREHVADGGELSALGALSAHVAEGQALFADCLAEAQNTAATAHPAGPRVATPPRTPPYTPSAVHAPYGLGPTLGQYLGVSSGGTEVSRPGTSASSWWGGAGSRLGSRGGSPNRRPGLGLGVGVGGGAAWDRLLRLGQLGLTQSEVARLEEIRRSWAARVIQRQVGGAGWGGRAWGRKGPAVCQLL